jgi:hypothetical protein
MAFLVKEVLELEMRVVHCESCIGCALLIRANGCICRATESLETGEEDASVDVLEGAVDAVRISEGEDVGEQCICDWDGEVRHGKDSSGSGGAEYIEVTDIEPG